MLDDIQDIEALAATGSLEAYLKFADQLEATHRYNYITRANFIREQCKGLDGKQLFDKYRDDWGVWNFSEELVTVEDFKNGFLWRFRDHTTSWSYNQKAKAWFLTSGEGLFIKRYEFWTCDNEQDECIDVREGSFKEILLSLLKDGDYEVLTSPVFSRSDLEAYIKNYKPMDGDYSIEEIIEDYIEGNPNYNND
jgi:hypothetical protein